jgi:hypothetical protein
VAILANPFLQPDHEVKVDTLKNTPAAKNAKR